MQSVFSCSHQAVITNAITQWYPFLNGSPPYLPSQNLNFLKSATPGTCGSLSPCSPVPRHLPSRPQHHHCHCFPGPCGCQKDQCSFSSALIQPLGANFLLWAPWIWSNINTTVFARHCIFFFLGATANVLVPSGLLEQPCCVRVTIYNMYLCLR